MGTGLKSGAVASTRRRRCLATRAECIWYLVSFDPRALCEDAHEFEQDPEVDEELMKNFKSRAVDTIRSVFEKDHSGCILGSVFEDGNPRGKRNVRKDCSR